MFDNVNKYVLWDLTTEAVRNTDQNTPQMEYEGEDRGQNQRFLITCGELVVTLFGIVENSYQVFDPRYTTTEMLFYLQRELGVQYVDDSSEALLREMLEEMHIAWSLRGTKAFLHWIIGKVFGWLVKDVYSTSKLLHTNRANSKLYELGLPLREQEILFDKGLYGTPLGSMTIDVDFDADYLEKKDVLEQLMDRWTFPLILNYINTP